MRILKIFLYFTYGFVVAAFLAAASLFAVGRVSFIVALLLVASSVVLNLVTYFYYRRLFIRQAEAAGSTKQAAIDEFETEFPSYKD